jgi:hypothetical protein
MSRDLPRSIQIEFLAESISKIADEINFIDTICIEPKGEDRQRKVPRANFDDIFLLEQYLKSLGLTRIG